ncbi:MULTISPECIES: DUF4184 family protein [unclassified Micromonospora]|uniref:DUF4184 family protein n=1 Tax=unclassified Micromonospora TaxID=2617518 RepID=UPI00098D33F2|nr:MULTISPECIES: DUF4184 family protein [unclassified Micromonospora]OON31265.1 hypothetical protein BSA16_12010 [Micromonospora sp. Rc5]
MPFTGSHPAAVLPFARSAMPLSALAIGSMAPDLPLYAPMPYTTRLSHHLVGVVTVDVLAGLVGYVVWIALLRPLVVAYAPSAVGRRVRPAQAAGPGRVVAALGVGALTHVLWDGFTHGGGWGTRLVPALDERIGALPAHEWAQYASSLIGAAAICWWAARRWRTATEVGDPQRPAAERLVPSRPLAAALVSVGVLAGAALGFRYGVAQPDPVRSALFHVAVRGTDVGLVITLCIALIHRRAARRHQAGSDRRSGRRGGLGPRRTD